MEHEEGEERQQRSGPYFDFGLREAEAELLIRALEGVALPAADRPLALELYERLERFLLARRRS